MGAAHFAVSPALRERLCRVGFPLGARQSLSTAEYFALFDEAAQSIGPDVGLRLAAAGGDAVSVSSHAALCSATFGDALAKTVRYKRLTCPEAITVSVVRDEARVRLEWLLADVDPPPALVDTVLASMLDLGRRGTGTTLTPRRVELARERANSTALRRYFGCDIVFDAPIDQLVFDASALALPMKTADAKGLRELDPQLERAMRLSGNRGSFLDEVRVALSRAMTGERPSVARVAKMLGLSSRTLQRRLQEEGVSYQELLDDVRQRTAQRLLARTKLRREEVAFLLGFEEFNSFTRAIRTWRQEATP